MTLWLKVFSIGIQIIKVTCNANIVYRNIDGKSERFLYQIEIRCVGIRVSIEGAKYDMLIAAQDPNTFDPVWFYRSTLRRKWRLSLT